MNLQTSSVRFASQPDGSTLLQNPTISSDIVNRLEKCQTFQERRDYSKKKVFDTNPYTAFKTFSDLFDRLACEDYHTADHILHRIRAR